MRFASISMALAFVTKAYGFAPSAITPVTRGIITAAPNSRNSIRELAAPISTTSRSTSLSLLGSRWLSRKFNGPAKVDSDITEKEVRALFELWNAALATGDSRIVASRYTKVSFSIFLGFCTSLLCCTLYPQDQIH